VCVPVTVAGRPVGVIHATGRDRRPPPERFNTQLGTLSTQLGNRLGALRALESSRQDAATDTLTALPNRRLLEAELGGLIEGAVPFVLVLADLDRFKALNDTFGHEVGDRALQLFAQVLRDKVRGNDVVARYGGEEFVLVYPRMSLTTSIEAIERIRDALALALEDSSLPEFTCSFGITHSSVGHSAEAILRVADAGLLRAKELGGDQVVFADETLAARMFGDDV
jgi:diguanylate cyclase (GGDEF)-like protein